MKRKSVPLVIAPYMNRSEYGPLQPLAAEYEKGAYKQFKFKLLDLTRLKTEDAVMKQVMSTLRRENPALVLCAFDRPLMTLTAFAAYHMGIPVCQIFAGDYAGGAFDDADRFCISNYSDLLFCADKPQYLRLQRALEWSRENKTVIVSGATHFDDMKFQDPGIRDYVLVLYNPSLYRGVDNLDGELNELHRLVGTCGKEVVWVAANGDVGSDKVEAAAKGMKNCTYLPDMPRTKFLGLVKHAEQFIGNSSCQFYEAQYFQTPIVQVGYRNIYREPISQAMCKPGASKLILDGIANHLKEKG